MLKTYISEPTTKDCIYLYWLNSAQMREEKAKYKRVRQDRLNSLLLCHNSTQLYFTYDDDIMIQQLTTERMIVVPKKPQLKNNCSIM